MKHKIVLLLGSARKESNSTALANSFMKVATESGIEVVQFDATKINVGVCRACNACFKNGKACAFDDDFNKITEALADADGLVIACPVYWYSFPAAIKAIIDKLYAFCIGENILKGKKVALLSCCEEESPDTFSGINFSFDRTFSLLEMNIVGTVEIPGVNEAGAIKNTDGEYKAECLAKAFAQKIGIGSETK